MGFGYAAVLSVWLLAGVAAQALPGQPLVRRGMSQSEVERLLGEPFYGYTRMGDPHAGQCEARYRQPTLRVYYQRGTVVRVLPPFRPLDTAHAHPSR